MPCKDPIKRKAWNDAYKAKNYERGLAQAKAYALSNPDKIKKKRAKAKQTALANPEKTFWRRSKKRAKKLCLPFNIEISDIVIPNICPVLGIPLFILGEKCTDNNPSVDRIDNTKGYVKGNVWVISWRANKIKGDASLEELQMIVKALALIDQ